MDSFNVEAWETFKSSKEGVKAIEQSAEFHASWDFDERFEKEFKVSLPVPFFRGEDVSGFTADPELDEFLFAEFKDHSVGSWEDAKLLYSSIVDLGFKVHDEDDDAIIEFPGGSLNKSNYRETGTHVDGLSLGLHRIAPEWFLPYFFRKYFVTFARICKQNGIALPPVPKKNDHKARAWYYFVINYEVQNFRRANNMSPVELNAFLYDFALESTDLELPENLPKTANRAWIVIGGTKYKGDFEAVENADDSYITCWQGNPNAKPGDIVVMYCSAPDSCLHSVWRVMQPGFVDPFFYYYSVGWISKCQRINPIPMKQLKNDKVFSKSSFVRSNAQGKSGTELTGSEYARIVKLAKEAKTIDLPQLRA